ncbi:EAL and HDOD domain-containing protein [Kineosporia succinea]|uniref:EAL and modified HD-GYP domain-containing signal transduction protein n=1 Tax=Kineosporia succinea TaxID=84632 RepID=A0ABT9P0S8_9ACTN|nr:HDOD domain-containing protein [Kineosporia succinea]MDP9826284.1 EAL and modified HD-GYP domain-containing signal transduction protein [Kineosporia succinea]
MHVARQAINDATGHLFGYELLFRSAAGATVADLDTDRATTQTILAAFAEFGAEELLGGKPGFINLTRSFLVGDLPLPFAPEAAVLEVLENIHIDREVVIGALRLASEGYRLALDDFVWSEEAEPLLAVADIVKIDVLSMTWEEVLFTVEKCRRHDVRLLAEKVENAEMYAKCIELGFELFQGYFLGRPETMSIETLSPGQQLALQLIGRLGDPNASTAEIERAVRRDPALVYRLLRIANSAAAGSTRQVSSIRDALVMVGLSRLRAWLILIALAPDSASQTAMVGALTRARTCERVAEMGRIIAPDTAFTAGLLDGIAEGLGLPSSDLLDRMPTLTPELSAALTGDATHPLRRVLTSVRAYEHEDLVEACRGPVPLQTMAEAYLQALAWTTETTRFTTVRERTPRPV